MGLRPTDGGDERSRNGEYAANCRSFFRGAVIENNLPQMQRKLTPTVLRLRLPARTKVFEVGRLGGKRRSGAACDDVVVIGRDPSSVDQ